MIYAYKVTDNNLTHTYNNTFFKTQFKTKLRNNFYYISWKSDTKHGIEVEIETNEVIQMI